MSQPNKSNEVDLLDLSLKAVSTLRQNFWLILVFFILGSALGLAYFFAARKVYQSKMILSSSILTTSYTKILFDNVNLHLEEGNYAAIAQQFKITEEAAAGVSALKIDNLNATEVELKESRRYLVTVEVFDREVLPQLQAGIINYLENNPYVKARVDQNKEFLKEMLATIDIELKEIDALKVRIYNGEFFSGVKGTVMFDPTVLNSKILDLTQKKINYKDSLELASSVHVINGFTKFDRQLRPKASLAVAAGSSMGLLFVIILIAFKSIRKLLKMAEANKQSNAA
ncbi:MAG: Wzz/FepE/Etk N-terminal domain-containing protein [Chryseolinea sp.]